MCIYIYIFFLYSRSSLQQIRVELIEKFEFFGGCKTSDDFRELGNNANWTIKIIRIRDDLFDRLFVRLSTKLLDLKYVQGEEGKKVKHGGSKNLAD